MQKHEELLLALLAATVNHDTNRCCALLPVDTGCWERVLALAEKHGVTGLVFSCMELLPLSCHPEKTVLLKLFGNAEYQKRHYRKKYSTAARFAAKLKERNVEMKVLKGISFSTYYNQPELRVFGDCDCYLTHLLEIPHAKRQAGSSGFNIGNEVIKQMGGKAEFGTYKHSHLFLDNLMIENHHYITDFNGTKLGKTIELLLEKAINCDPGDKIGNTEMVRPCAHFNALHLIRHAQGNFILSGMILRMIYDWAVFLRSEQDNLNWNQLYEDYEICHLRRFVDVMTSICVEYLGLKLTCDNITLCKDRKLVDKVLKDTLEDSIHMIQDESIGHKSLRILLRFYRMVYYRGLAIESIPTMIWNTFAFSSYMKRQIHID